jgi:hypothetical protein
MAFAGHNQGSAGKLAPIWMACRMPRHWRLLLGQELRMRRHHPSESIRRVQPFEGLVTQRRCLIRRGCRPFARCCLDRRHLLRRFARSRRSSRHSPIPKPGGSGVKQLRQSVIPAGQANRHRKFGSRCSDRIHTGEGICFLACDSNDPFRPHSQLMMSPEMHSFSQSRSLGPSPRTTFSLS